MQLILVLPLQIMAIRITIIFREIIFLRITHSLTQPMAHLTILLKRSSRAKVRPSSLSKLGIIGKLLQWDQSQSVLKALSNQPSAKKTTSKLIK